MIELRREAKTEGAPRRRVPWLLVVPALPVIIMVTVLTLERWGAKLALSAWKDRMSAQGEVFDPKRIWPPPSERSLQFSNDFARATRDFLQLAPHG